MTRGPVPATAMGLCALLLSACANHDGSVLDNMVDNHSRPDLSEAARLNTQLGIDYARQGKDDLALEKLKRALDQDSSLASAHSTIAFVYARQGEDQLAEKEYKRALELDTKDPDTRNSYAVFLCAHGKPAEADRYFMEAVNNRSYRTPEVALTNAGVCALKGRDYPKAENYFRNALAANRAFPDALAQMATVSYQRKDYLRARAFLQRYEAVGAASPSTLLVGAQTEAALGDMAAAKRYVVRLKKEFPESAEAGQTPRVTP